MKTVKAAFTFVGSDAELEKYGGQVPADLKKFEKKMSEAEKNSFAGKITAGTELEVSDERAKVLADLGLVEGPKGKKEEAATEEKVADATHVAKNAEAGPKKKATKK